MSFHIKTDDFHIFHSYVNIREGTWNARVFFSTPVRCTPAWRGRCYPSPPCRAPILTVRLLNLRGINFTKCKFHKHQFSFLLRKILLVNILLLFPSLSYIYPLSCIFIQIQSYSSIFRMFSLHIFLAPPLQPPIS